MTRLLISCGFWISSQHDLPSDARAFLSKVDVRIWITKRFSSSPRMWCFPTMLYHPGPSSLVLFAKAYSLTFFEVKIKLNRAFRFFIFFQKRKGERLSWFAFSSRRGTFDRGCLCRPRIDTDRFWFSPCWAGFVRRVMSMFAALNRGTCRGCNCSFSELVKLAQVTNFPATWVTDPIRILHEMNKQQSNFFTNFGWHNPKALLSFWCLNSFSEEEWPCFPRLLPNLT